MNENTFKELSQKVIDRKNHNNPELLTIEEMKTITRKDIRKIAEELTFDLVFEFEWFYAENRQWTNEQLLEETEEEIKEFEKVYGTDFETEFGHLTSYEADCREDASNYYDWQSLIELRNYYQELIKNAENL